MDDAKKLTTEKGTVSPVILFLIGFSTGFISTIFPRLITFLSTSKGGVFLKVFPEGFFYATIAVATIIGVCMVWIYLGTSENTKNLFMAALAIPSILSGGINMSNTAASSQYDLQALSSEITTLNKALRDESAIPEADPITFDDEESASGNGNALLDLFGVRPAFGATNVVREEPNRLNPSVQFNIPVTKKRYRILLKKSEDREALNETLMEYQREFEIPHLKIKKSQDMYYLILDRKMSESEALIESLSLKKKFNIKPKLLPSK